MAFRKSHPSHWHDLGKHLPATLFYPFKNHSRAAVGYMIPLHRRSHRGQRHVCKHPFLDLISVRQENISLSSHNLCHLENCFF